MVITIKYHLLNYLYKFVLVTILVAVIIIELVRLYLGYLGNLTEKVPELAGFWLLTILLQLPLQGFLLLNTDLILVPIGNSIYYSVYCRLCSTLQKVQIIMVFISCYMQPIEIINIADRIIGIYYIILSIMPLTISTVLNWDEGMKDPCGATRLLKSIRPHI